MSNAKNEVFASGDLVFLFKSCFTLRNFALNRAFVRFAWNRQIDIVVDIPESVDPYAYQKAASAGVPFRVREICWPARLNPTSNPFAAFEILEYILKPSATVRPGIEHLVQLNIMTEMLRRHAPHLRRLEIHLAFAGDLADPTIYPHISLFFGILDKCTAIETLVVTQTDHRAQDASLDSIQCTLFGIIKTRRRLRVLDFCGNMTVDATNATIDPTSGTQNQLTMIDYLPPSLCELVIRDGPRPRMYKWKEFYGFSAGLKLAMCNGQNRFPCLRSLSLPSSFWALMPHEFGGFVLYLNSQCISTLGFSDPFKLNQSPFKPTVHGVPSPKPKHSLYYLIETLVQDMVIDIRGGDSAERAARTAFATQIVPSSVVQSVFTADGKEHSTVTIHKSHRCTVQVLI